MVVSSVIPAAYCVSAPRSNGADGDFTPANIIAALFGQAAMSKAISFYQHTIEDAHEKSITLLWKW